MKFTLGFSPCPNDTFIFDALVNHKIDTEGFEFKPVLEDVETLNKWAINGKLDITKLSFGVFPAVMNNYILFNSGSALGKGVGPLLISKENIGTKAVEENIIALPGQNTTAHLLFSLAYPAAKNKVFMRYDEIENYVIQNRGLGVIIHENRFTYNQKGLHKIKDLGDLWEQQTGSPIPLGGIVGKRIIDKDILLRLDGLIKKSIQYAYAEYPALTDFIRTNAKEMSEDVMRKHIELYVNEFSLDLGNSGRSAVEKLLQPFMDVNGNHYAGKEIFLVKD
jgi:1,4-dihydroxy-6-naphthoate synthase